MSFRSLSLLQAVTSRDEGSVKALLSEGADVNARNNSGQTPLILAIVSGQDHLLKLLLEAGANPLLRDHTQLNAIDWAERKGRSDLPQILSPTQPRNSSTRNLNEKLFETEKESPASLDELRNVSSISSDEKSRDVSSISSDEKSRKWLAGIKRRIEEEADRETTKDHSVSSQTNQSNIMRSGSTLPVIPEEVTPEISNAGAASDEVTPETSKAVPIIDKVTPEINKAGFIAQQVTPEISNAGTAIDEVTPETSKAAPIIDKVTPEINKTGFIAQQITPEIGIAPLSTDDAVPEIFPRTIAEIPRAPTHGVQLASTQPSRPSSSRKRCPKCNTIYNSELLAYCAYHIVPLIDADEAIVISKANNSASVLWILVLIALSLAGVVGVFLSGYMYKNNDRPGSSAPTVTTTRQGIPVLGSTLVGKSVNLPAAEIRLQSPPETAAITVRVKIDRGGRVVAASSSESDQLLREAVIEAAEKSTFSVEKLRGRGAEGTITYMLSQ